MTAMRGALVERRQTIPAPRRQSEKLKHPLGDLSLLGFCGVWAGCEDFVAIAEWGKVNEACLRTFLELPPGIASPDPFPRVLALLQPRGWPEGLLPWLLARRGMPGDGIHLDGKTLRQTRRKSQKVKARQVVSAGAGQSGITLGQVAVAAKANEITARPQLLEVLDLRDKMVTTEARGCQKEIAKTLVTGGGDYILAAKEKQPTLQAEIPAAFAQAPAPKLSSPRVATTFDKGHGRDEPRTVQGLPAREQLSAAQCALWLGVLTVVRVTRVVGWQATGAQSTEVSSFLSSLQPNARRIGRAIRGHWSIENGLHWVLDVVFREDARRVYDRTAAENGAFLNRLALSLLRGDPGKSSMKVKRKRAGWSIPYLAQLLGFPST
jgi:predicted transposase YbfD/YdcC